MYLWHDQSAEWGARWSVGDVVGCAVDMEARVMSFFLNGFGSEIEMGTAFCGFSSCGGIYPAASFNRHEKITFNFGLYLQILDRNANLTGRFIDFKSDSDDLLNYDLLVRGDSCSGYRFLSNTKLTGNIEESIVKSTLSYSSKHFILPRPHTFVFKHLLTNDVISSDLDLDLPTTNVNHKFKVYLNSQDEFKSLKLAEIEIKQPTKDLAEKLFYEKLDEEIKFGLVNFDLDISNLHLLQDLYNLDRQNLNEFVVSLKKDSRSYENEKLSISDIINLELIAVKNQQSKFFEFNLEMGRFENDYSYSRTASSLFISLKVCFLNSSILFST
jgi:hypothetical protein